MKKLIPAFVLAILLVGLSTPGAWGCSIVCTMTTTPWGTPYALCLDSGTDSGFQICIEVNSKVQDMDLHECYTSNPCRNGYPIA